MSKKSVTIQEIADHVGVSIATVSRVVHGFDQISPATRGKVLAAISELGYRPSHLGRALVERRHAAVGIVFPGLAGPYYSEVIQGFEEDAAAAKLSVLILGTHLLRESADLVLSMADRVDGLAITGGSIPDEMLDALATRGVPVVQMAGMPRRGVPTVRSQTATSMERLTTHLISDHGYDNLAFIGNPTGSPDVSERWKGFCAAHRKAGVRAPRAPFRIGLEQPHGTLAATRLLARRTPPRALMCANDETAIGALVAVLGKGLKVPEDIAIVGFDDIPMAGLTEPGLTTVHQPMRELGTQTARTLRQRISGEIDDDVDLVLDTDLVLRGSCGCRASGGSGRTTAQSRAARTRR